MKNKAFTICIFIIFVVLDAGVFYYMGRTALNLSVVETCLIGLVIASILDALALLAGKNGMAILQDDDAEIYEKKTAIKYVVFCTPIVLTALVFVAYSRVNFIQRNMADNPEYNLLFDLLALLVPFATTVGSFCLGLSAHELRVDINNRKFEEARREYNEKLEEHDTLFNNKKLPLDKIGFDFGITDLMIAVQNDDNQKKVQFMNAVSRRAADGVTESVNLHLQNNYRALLEAIKELPLKLDKYGPAPGILVACAPSEEWFKKALRLNVIDHDFQEMLNTRIQQYMATAIGSADRTRT